MVTASAAIFWTSRFATVIESGIPLYEGFYLGWSLAFNLLDDPSNNKNHWQKDDHDQPK
jgi:hypothetical protein